MTNCTTELSQQASDVIACHCNISTSSSLPYHPNTAWHQASAARRKEVAYEGVTATGRPEILQAHQTFVLLDRQRAEWLRRMVRAAWKAPVL